MPLPSNPADQPPASPGAGATVDQWLTYLEAIHPTEIDLGLDRVLVVLRRLFRRKPSARIITVAGTNGKGSAVATVEALLRAAGRRTGAYTSPHLQRYNERVRLNGEDISDDALVSAFEAVEEARGNVSLTYFEFGTLAAFVAFAGAGLDDWVLEVGLGGRLDAVNVLDADFAILTSVDIDHVAFLGDNREVIGFEKAGVLRPGIPSVYADSDPPRSVLQQATAQKVELALLGRDYELVTEQQAGDDAPAVELRHKGRAIRLPAGPLPIKSVAAAVVAIRELEPNLPVPVIEQVLSGLSVPGRFERVGSAPDIFLDVGHNPHAAGWLSGQLSQLKSPGRRVHGVYGALADKDVAGVGRAMVDVVDAWYLAGLKVPRGLSGQDLQARLSDSGIQATAFESVREALVSALAVADPNDLVVVFGSFFTVAEGREILLAGKVAGS
ncbi:folylpolyglutamate synthase [Marinobacter sp. CP1]|jgi:dihydrofolate synthase/folylpolyglutamate synthase|uniref:bifunctional tetrahydrofolate synthase/dihydrofolate synthase n=1 Tax=unclassified Marinobacter TaxID=83889 RepID=UPI00069E70A5|nr:MULTISPECIES: bifunctional tetrahydrofolate synthase/dihydrofolate synthase [unclassified Marinobacter]AKV98490.1 folylpolyglutamate synthase [Marinobacter sp. CP1]|tara:strand:- start:867 stop:2189 length:1323 start_codon:yes stop_codon:yes gene_type:complete